MAEEKRSYLVLRPDGFIVYTKPVTYEEAEWLHSGAYYDVADRSARGEYLNQWGSVLDLAARRQWEQQLINIVEYYIGDGVYADPYIVRERIELLLNDFGWQRYKDSLWWLRTEIDDLLRRPAEPARHEGPSEPSMAREVIDGRSAEREGSQDRGHGRDSTDSAARTDGSRGGRLEADVLRDVIWPWSQVGSVEAVIARRDRAEDELGPALAGGSNVAETGAEGEARLELAAGGYEKTLRKTRRGNAANREKGYTDDAEALPA